MKVAVQGLLVLFLIISLNLVGNDIFTYAEDEETDRIVLKDADLIVEEYASGLKLPVMIDFIDESMLVIEKDGTVRIIKDEILASEPVLQLEVSTTSEEGLLGILVQNNDVFLHYTTSNVDDDTTSNWFTKYTWNGEKLIDPVELLSFHSGAGDHNSGVMIEDKDGVIFGAIGDMGYVGGQYAPNNFTLIENEEMLYQNSLSDKSEPVGSVLSLNTPREIYAIGIRNTFGLDIDPVTGILWDTENGPNLFDEVNLVQKKFNSGWNKIMGPIKDNEETPKINGYEYSDPEFSWERTVAVTSIHFIQSPLFPEYENSVLIGSFAGGILYKFELNENRDGFRFDNNELEDLVLNKEDNPNEIIFGTGFAGITDIKEGPDGSIYVVTIGDGKIFRISPALSENIVKSNCQNFSDSKNFSGCNFSSENFINKDFSNKDFSFTDFSNSNLVDINFQSANLVNSNFHNAQLSNVNFLGANLDSVIFKEANIENTNFNEASLVSADFQKTTLSVVNFERSNLERSFFNNAELENAKFMYANLKGAGFESSNLTSADFENTDLMFANFYNAILKNANFDEAKLWKTKLNNADLENASFVGTDNYNSEFKKSNLKNVDFQSSYLSGVDFTDADLTNVNLLYVYPVDSIFDDANLTNAKINTCLEHDAFSRILNKILRSIEGLNLEFFEKLIISACK
tara:strand:- start:504 stop:2561 length:2058 start_codon:yes stop_codon:yes gene_type:complete